MSSLRFSIGSASTSLSGWNSRPRKKQRWITAITAALQLRDLQNVEKDELERTVPEPGIQFITDDLPRNMLATIGLQQFGWGARAIPGKDQEYRIPAGTPDIYGIDVSQWIVQTSQARAFVCLSCSTRGRSRSISYRAKIEREAGACSPPPDPRTEQGTHEQQIRGRSKPGGLLWITIKICL